jgi:hypothetical protein
MHDRTFHRAQRNEISISYLGLVTDKMDTASAVLLSGCDPVSQNRVFVLIFPHGDSPDCCRKWSLANKMRAGELVQHAALISCSITIIIIMMT